MNFLAALLLLAVNDEVLAFVLLGKVMKDLKWREIYLDGLVKLFDLSSQIKKWLKSREKIIAVHMDCHGILLEAQLASPFMVLFANLLPLPLSLRILDRFLYFGEEALVNIVKEVYTTNKMKIIQIKESFEL